jgi:hypothetical protein
MEKMQKQAAKNPPIVTGNPEAHLVVIAGYMGRCRKCWETHGGSCERRTDA